MHCKKTNSTVYYNTIIYFFTAIIPMDDDFFIFFCITKIKCVPNKTHIFSIWTQKGMEGKSTKPFLRNVYSQEACLCYRYLWMPIAHSTHNTLTRSQFVDSTVKPCFTLQINFYQASERFFFNCRPIDNK